MLGQCEKKHYYAFQRKLQPKSGSIALQRGNAGHAMFEAFLTAKREGYSDDAAKNLALIAPKSTEYDLLPRGEAAGYVSYWIDNIWPTLGWEVVEVEKEFRVPVNDEITYPFKTDAIIRKKGGLYIVDHKFTYDCYSENVVGIIPQLPRYMAGLIKLGIPIKGGIYNFVRTRKLNDPAARFAQIDVPISQPRLNETVRELMLGFEKVLKAREPDFNAVRTANKMNCDNCGFYALCVAELNEKPTRLLEKVQYEPNTYGYSEEES